MRKYCATGPKPVAAVSTISIRNGLFVCQPENHDMVDVLAIPGWRRALHKLHATFWPPTCVLCARTGQLPAVDLCAACEADLPVNAPACGVCAQLLAGGSGAESAKSWVCGACLRRPPPFDASHCPFRYAYPLDHLVQGLKYHGAVAQGRVLGELLAHRIQASRSATLPQLIVPVPLGRRRFRDRGYNQAIELARYVGKHLEIPIRTDLVVRTRETHEQAALNKPDRSKNIRGAFAAIGKVPALHVAIVDDVITTGSTVNELAKVLKRAGAVTVEVWAVARVGGKKRMADGG